MGVSGRVSDAKNAVAGALFVGVGRFADLKSMSNLGLTRFDDLAAVWHDAPDALNARRIHHEMVTACCRRGAFLPARFGLVAHAGEHLISLLADHRERLRKALAAVEGYVEISVEVGRESEAGEVRNLTKSKAIERLETIAQAIRVEAGLQDSQSRTFISAEARPRLTMALLAPSVAAFTIADRLEKRLRRFSVDHQAKVSGPWPPYHFSELSGFAPVEIVKARLR